MKKMLFLVFWLLPCWLSAQTVDSVTIKQVDSLLMVVKQQTSEKQYAQAMATNAAAEKLALETFGRQSLPYANCCYRHATILQNQWNKTNIEEAVKWVDEALAIRQSILGKDHLECVRCLTKLAAFHAMLRQYDQAQAYSVEARRILEETNNTDDADYPVTLNSLADSYSNLGNYAKGEAVYLISKQHMEKKGGRESKAYVVLLSQLANLNLWVNNNVKALQYAQEAADIYKKMGGEHDVYYAFCLRIMVQANMRLKQYEEAEKQILQALDIVEKTVGKNDFRYADILSLCGTLYNYMKAYDKAVPILIESLQLVEKSTGKDNLQYSGALSNLATAYIETGQLKKAEPLFLEAVAIQEKYMDGGHVALTVFNRLASLHRMTGHFDLAESLYRKMEARMQTSILNKINYMSEAELQQLISGSAYLEDNAFSLAYIATLRKALPPTMAGICYDHALLYKGFLQQSAIRARQLAATHPGSRADLDSLKTLQGQLAKMYAAPKDQGDLTGIASVEAKADDIQKKIAREIAGYKEATQQVHWSDVQKSLRRGEAAVEFVRFDYYNQSVQFPTDSILYAAVLLLSDGQTPRFIPLFEEKQLAVLLNAEAKSPPAFYNDLYAPDKKGRQLYELIWKPIAAALPEGTTVYCSPSGLLHRLHLGAIPTPDGKTMAEKHRLTMLGSTRQLAVPPVSAPKPTATAQLYGGIQYDAAPLVAANTDAKSDELVARRGADFAQNDSTLRGETWNYLRWTEVEISAAAEIMTSKGMAVTLKKGAEATEESFKALGTGGPSPRILHVATHGFFFPDPKGEKVNGEQASNEKTFKVSENPMIRSGLVLAGGNQAWKTGKPARPDLEDGILTAYEISQMNLANTELVVLSACETGLGDLVGNEGVYGLQRAFKIAGVRYLIMSLWQVPDFQTQVFMSAFYKHWLEGNMTIPEAFRATQSELQAKYGEAFKWAGFVLLE